MMDTRRRNLTTRRLLGALLALMCFTSAQACRPSEVMTRYEEISLKELIVLFQKSFELEGFQLSGTVRNGKKTELLFTFSDATKKNEIHVLDIYADDVKFPRCAPCKTHPIYRSEGGRAYEADALKRAENEAFERLMVAAHYRAQARMEQEMGVNMHAGSVSWCYEDGHN